MTFQITDMTTGQFLAAVFLATTGVIVEAVGI